MENDMILPPLGVTFYAPTDENFKSIAKIRESLEAAGIATVWVTKEWHGKKVTALDVYAHGNVVAQHMSAAK